MSLLLLDRFLNGNIFRLTMNEFASDSTLSVFFHHDKDPIHTVILNNWNWTIWPNPGRNVSLVSRVTFSQSVDSLPSNGEAKISVLSKHMRVAHKFPLRGPGHCCSTVVPTLQSWWGGGGHRGKEERKRHCNSEKSEPLLSCRNTAWKIHWFQCMSNPLAIFGNSRQC